MFEWLFVLPIWIWALVIGIMAASFLVFYRLFIAVGIRHRVQYWFKDGSCKILPVEISEDKITFYPYKQGFRKGQPVVKPITDEPYPMTEGAIVYRTFGAAEGYEGTFHPLKLLRKIESGEENETSPIVVSVTTARGFIETLSTHARRAMRGFKEQLYYLLLGAPIGSVITLAIILATGHYA